MGYHDVRLPTTFSAGSLFGPSFQTKIISLDSLAEHRVARGPTAGRRSYSLERGISDLDDLYILYEFFIARQGALNTFRLKDWLDYATNATGTTHRDSDVAVAYDDVDLVLVDGSPLTGPYQFVKRYSSGSQTVVRTLTKLVSGTVKVGDHSGGAGAAIELTTGFTLSLTTGQVTFSVAPTGQVTGGCEFDVPVRFSEDTDRSLAVAIEAVDTGNLPEIKCIEDVDPVVVSQDFPFGGCKNHGVVTADVQISELDGRLQIFAPTAGAWSIKLPLETSLPLGGPYFCLKNAGSVTMKIKTSAGGTLVDPFAIGGIKTVWLGLNSSAARTWYVI